MLGSQEKILEPKVNVKFFTVDPYTQCNRVSRPFGFCYFSRIKEEAEGEVKGDAERSWKNAQTPSLLLFKLAVLICYVKVAEDLKHLCFFL